MLKLKKELVSIEAKYEKAKAVADALLQKVNDKKAEIQSYGNKEFKCVPCGLAFPTEGHLQKHKKTMSCRVKSGEPHFRCQMCNRIFFDGVWNADDLFDFAPRKVAGYRKVINDERYKKSSYKAHNKECMKLNYCEICDVQLENKAQRQRHMSSYAHKQKVKEQEQED